MARARTPAAKAKATGADIKNPGRHKERTTPRGLSQLGPATPFLDPFSKKAFELFRRELPWLKESHRVLVELASRYRGRMLDPDPDAPGLSLASAQELRRCLAQLGATPADESRINVPNGGEEDPEEALFKPSGAPKPH